MDVGLSIAASGMVAEQTRQDQLSNDLANASTPGYKPDSTPSHSFGEVLLDSATTGQPIGSMNMGVALGKTYTDMAPAGMQRTNEPLDFGIVGVGFFAVRTPQGVRYTRDGQYIFSGTLTGTAPYAQGANDEYHGNSGAIARSVGPGATIDVTVSVKSLLGEGQASGDGKLLDTLRTIAKNLREGTPEALKALSGQDLEAIEANLSTLGNLQAEVGAATDQITSALNRVEDLQNTTTTQLSNIQDANFAQVSMEFSSQQAAYNAALRAGASIVQESPLEFLH
jgi:flagellar hook-basal body protein